MVDKVSSLTNQDDVCEILWPERASVGHSNHKHDFLAPSKALRFATSNTLAPRFLNFIHQKSASRPNPHKNPVRQRNITSFVVLLPSMKVIGSELIEKLQKIVFFVVVLSLYTCFAIFGRFFDLRDDLEDWILIFTLNPFTGFQTSLVVMSGANIRSKFEIFCGGGGPTLKVK